MKKTNLPVLSSAEQASKQSALRSPRGFTLIEIVIVLAIAGLILVIVFLAVSGAQASRRDAQRRSDVSRLRAALEQYASNNRGSYPTTAADWASCATANSLCNKYLGGANFKDPAGAAYTLSNAGTFTAASLTAASGTINVGTGATDGAKCDTTAPKLAIIADTGKPRSYAIQYYLEQGGVVCVDNQ